MCSREFLGLWDTVSSVRYLWKNPTFDHSRTNPSVVHVRHAIALDERRAYFRQNTWNRIKDQDAVEMWFAGVHSDVGGGYLAAESGLPNVALAWMLDEVLRLPHPIWIDPGMRDRWLPAQDGTFGAAPNPLAPAHESLKGFWWPMEFLPKRYKDAADNFRTKWRIPRGRYRRVPDGALLHRSVEARVKQGLWKAERLPPHHTFG